VGNCVLRGNGEEPLPGAQGGAAEFVARQLDERLREHLRQRSNLMNENAVGLAASLQRPLLCLFDRNFELSVVSQLFRDPGLIPAQEFKQFVRSMFKDPSITSISSNLLLP
jgi:hypothetical protein